MALLEFFLIFCVLWTLITFPIAMYLKTKNGKMLVKEKYNERMARQIAVMDENDAKLDRLIQGKDN